MTEWKRQHCEEQETATEREIIKLSGGDKVSKSNLAVCDPISTATLCVCSEQFVSFGTERLLSPCKPPSLLPSLKRRADGGEKGDAMRERDKMQGEEENGEREKVRERRKKIKSEWGTGR